VTVDRAIVLLDPRFDRHAVHVAASRARDETRLVVDCFQIDALLSSGVPLDRAQKAEPASVEDRRALLAERLSNGPAKTSTIAVIEQATLPAKQADRHRSRQSADRAMLPPTKPLAAQEAAWPAPRSTARARDPKVVATQAERARVSALSLGEQIVYYVSRLNRFDDLINSEEARKALRSFGPNHPRAAAFAAQ
jgi:hypothetical protein